MLTDAISTSQFIEPIQNIDSKELLQSYGVPYQEIEDFLYVGRLEQQEGWILHLSVIKIQFSTLLNIIIPFLIGRDVPFAIVKNSNIVKHILDGIFGYGRIGKLISIYTTNGEEALQLAKELISRTNSFKGPAIPSDLLLGNIVYTMYGKFYSKEFNHYTIPFRLPEGITWPYGEITLPILPAVKKLWNYRYKPLSVIKQDPKGRVIKGNYFKSFFTIKSCVIKEGIPNMWSDEWGRDVVDRLRWQYELYKKLREDISIPRMFDLFYENGNAYLVMEFIAGTSLEEGISSIFNGGSWIQLNVRDKQTIIDYLFNVVNVISQLHKKGFVHRDITPTNFIIDKKGIFHLIDMELAYSFNDNKPDPAFKLGTPGYASPQQLQHRTPSTKDDIYGLGALMTSLFTGLSPVKFEQQTRQKRKASLLFFTESELLASLIEKCLSKNPEERPTLKYIHENVERYQKALLKSVSVPQSTGIHLKITDDDLCKLINDALRGLMNPLLKDNDYIWKSLKKYIDTVAGYQPIERMPQLGWHAGIAGILCLIAKAHKAGYFTEPCIQAYMNNWRYIENYFLCADTTVSHGLYDGLAGIALTLKEGISSGLLPLESCKQYLELCFSTTPLHYDLAKGIAGQGLAILQTSHLLEPAFVETKLRDYVSTLLAKQQSDGSWNIFRVPGKKNEKILGFAHGIAGVIYFLINYALIRNDKTITPHLRKGLHWLIKKLHLKKKGIFWNTTTKSRNIDKWGTNVGIPGIVLVFIKAYEWSGESLYKEIANQVLHSLPSQPIHIDFTQAYGMSGLGEVYLEANRVFKNEEWGKRADWIANVLFHTVMTNEDNSGYWSVNVYSDPEMDLMTGDSGIIHFLMRYQRPSLIPYIL